MASVSSNLDDFIEGIERVSTCFRLRRPTKSGRMLGEVGLELFRKNDLSRALGSEKGPSTAPYWAPNREWAEHDPRKAGKGIGMLGDSHNMLDEANYKGPVLITDDEAVEISGADEETQLKLEWFQDPFQGTDKLGRTRDQAPRKIHGDDENTTKDLDALFDAQHRDAVNGD
jgi:hypothetical protein